VIESPMLIVLFIFRAPAKEGRRRARATRWDL